MAHTARARKFQSPVWNNGRLMLLLSPSAGDDDRALCKRCHRELAAGVSYGTRHLVGHLTTAECLRRAAGDEEADIVWAGGDAVAELQARSPAAVQAAQWRQGPDTMLLLRERPPNMAQLQRQGFRVLLLPELERRVQALMQEMQGLLVQQQPTHIGWLPELTDCDVRFVQAYDDERVMRSGGGLQVEEASYDDEQVMRSLIRGSNGNYCNGGEALGPGDEVPFSLNSSRFGSQAPTWSPQHAQGTSWWF